MATLDRVAVRFLQKDMAASLMDLPYSRRDRYGKTLFTENVVWADVWLAERKEDPTVWTGFIRDGEIYLEQAMKGGFQHARSGTQKRPSLLSVGFYKIWIDAWTRPGEEVYEQDRFTMTDQFDDGDASRWKAPPVPRRKHWQDIQVKRPDGGGGPARVYVKSRRFHWLCRLSRLMFTLEKVLDVRERNAVLASRVRDQAVYLLAFLSAIEESNTMALTVPMLNWPREKPFPKDPKDWPNWGKLREIKNTLHDVFLGADNFVRYGAGGNDAGLSDHQHANNLAHLIWRLIHEDGFQADVAAAEGELAMEHRSLLARIPALLNRVPLAFEGLELDPTSGSYAQRGASKRYGEAFAQEFARPFIERMASADPAWAALASVTGQGSGGSSQGGAAPKNGKNSTVKWLDGVRKYGWAMMNATSIFWARKPADCDKLITAMEKLENSVFRAAQADIEHFRRLGREDVVKRLIKNGTLLKPDDLKKLGKTVDLSDWESFKKVEGELAEARGGQPDRISKALERGNPNALYMIEGFEIFVKTLVAISALKALKEEAAKGGARQPRWGSTEGDAYFKALDALGSLLKSTAFKNFVKWTLENAKPGLGGPVADMLDVTGRWTSFGVDLYSAWVSSGDMFSNAYGDKLLERYMPEDAVTSYGFHLVIWSGKWLNASGSLVTGANKKLPLGYALAGLGYLCQFIGEFGEAAVSVGGLEHKHFNRVHQSLWEASVEAKNRLASYGIDFYPYQACAGVKSMEGMVDWLGVDRDRYRQRFPMG